MDDVELNSQLEGIRAMDEGKSVIAIDDSATQLPSSSSRLEELSQAVLVGYDTLYAESRLLARLRRDGGRYGVAVKEITSIISDSTDAGDWIFSRLDGILAINFWWYDKTSRLLLSKMHCKHCDQNWFWMQWLSEDGSSVTREEFASFHDSNKNMCKGYRKIESSFKETGREKFLIALKTHNRCWDFDFLFDSIQINSLKKRRLV